MMQFQVTGMSCAACSARVEKAVGKVTGVESCSVSLLTGSMGVEGAVKPEEIIRAVEDAGYGASLRGNEKAEKAVGAESEEMLKDKETPILKRRLLASLLFLILLMYVSMGHVMWNWPLPMVVAKNPMMIGLIQFLLTAVIMVINQKFFVSGFKGLIKGAPNMDTLVALGSGAAFVYSTYALFAMADAMHRQDMTVVHGWLHEFYFESAAMILALITVGKMLEARAKGKTTGALKGLMDLAPKTATLLVEGKEKKVPIGEVQRGAVFVVRPGESIPVDGVILEGESAIDEATLTGESIPVDKKAGERIYGATINQSGFLKCEATEVGEDTTLSQIIKMVSDAAATKAPIAKIADKVSGIFVPLVIGIALVTIAVWLLIGETIGFAIARGISVLVISCPCALGLATPVAIMVGNGVGAKQGIMFKTADSLEETGKTQIVVLDKTGTITKGQPKVTDILPGVNFTEATLFELAYALEKKSEHPLAKAILEYKGEVTKEAKETREVTDFVALPGNGLMAKWQDVAVYGGNLSFIETKVIVPEDIKQKAEQLAEEGKTPLFFAKDKELTGIIAVADVMKEDSRDAILRLKKMGIRVVMLTGDNPRTANAIGKAAGVNQVIAGVLPNEKADVIQKLQAYGKVTMVGDGINDAPALTKANIGMAIAAGTDISIDAADVVLMKSRLSDVPAAIRLSRTTLKNIKQNLFWAFCYNVIGIPLAAGVFIPFFGWQLNPMFGAAAMSLSSFCVVSNALRLNFCKLYDEKTDGKIKAVDLAEIKIKEERKMEKKMTIKGMMCGHCEARVKKTLEALPEVAEAIVNHETDTAVVKLNGEISDETLRKAIEEQDYEVVSIQ